LVYYVGETGFLLQCSLQHVQSYLNGFYRVFDPKNLKKAERFSLGGMWKTDRREPNYYHAIARDEKEAGDLIDQNFQYVCTTPQSIMMFRKGSKT